MKKLEKIILRLKMKHKILKEENFLSNLHIKSIRVLPKYFVRTIVYWGVSIINNLKIP